MPPSPQRAGDRGGARGRQLERGRAGRRPRRAAAARSTTASRPASGCRLSAQQPRARPASRQPRLAGLEQTSAATQLDAGRRAGACGARRRRAPWAAPIPSRGAGRSSRAAAGRDRRSSPPSAGAATVSSRARLTLRGASAACASSSARASASSRRSSTSRLPARARPPTGARAAPRPAGDARSEEQAVEGGQHRHRHAPGPSPPDRSCCANIATRPMTVPIMPIAGATSAAWRQTPIAAVVARAAVLELLARPGLRSRRCPRRRRAGRRRGGRTRPASSPGRRRRCPYIRRDALDLAHGAVGGAAVLRRAAPEAAAAAPRARGRASPPVAEMTVAEQGAADDDGRRREGRKTEPELDHFGPPAAPAKICRRRQYFAGPLPSPCRARGASSPQPPIWHDRCIEARRTPLPVNLTAGGAKI